MILSATYDPFQMRDESPSGVRRRRLFAILQGIERATLGGFVLSRQGQPHLWGWRGLRGFYCEPAELEQEPWTSSRRPRKDWEITEQQASWLWQATESPGPFVVEPMEFRLTPRTNDLISVLSAYAASCRRSEDPGRADVAARVFLRARKESARALLARLHHRSDRLPFLWELHDFEQMKLREAVSWVHRAAQLVRAPGWKRAPSPWTWATLEHGSSCSIIIPGATHLVCIECQASETTDLLERLMPTDESLLKCSKIEQFSAG